MPKIENNLIKILVQTGCIGLALVSMYFFYNITSNHISHNTAALIKLEGAIDQFSEVEKQQTEVLRDLKNVILRFDK